MVVEGTMTNNAQLTTYREVRMMMYFDDSESAVMDSTAKVLFESLAPGAKSAFKLKEKGPKRSKSIRLMVADAIPAE